MASTISMMPRTRVAILLLGLAACARAPLVAIDPTSPLSVNRDAIGQARTAAKLGHLDEAAAIARDAAAQARLDAALAELEADASAGRDAERRWRSTARVARTLARRTDDRDAQLEAVLASPHPRRHFARLQRLPGGFSLQWNRIDDGHAAFARRGEDDVPSLDAPVGTTSKQRLARFEALPQKLQRDVDRATTALTDAIYAEAPRAKIVQRAKAVIELDPWHVPAALVVAIDRDIAARRIHEYPELFDDAVHGWGPGPLARLLLLWRESEAPSIGLAWSFAALERGLIGDATTMLADPRLGTSPLRDELVVLAALHRGDPEPLAKWRKDNAAPSFWLDGRLAPFDSPSRESYVRVLGRRARAQLTDARYVNDDVALHVVADADAKRTVRRRARRMLSRSQRRLVDACATAGDETSECLALDSGFPGHGASRFARDEAVRARIFAARGSATFEHPWSLATAELDASALATSPWFQRAAVDDALADEDGDRAKRLVDRHQRSLGVSSLLSVAVSRGDGTRPLRGGTMPSIEDFGATAWGAEDDTGTRAELGAAFDAAAEGDYAKAATQLDALAKRFEGRVGAWLSALHGYAALRADDRPAYVRALERTGRLAPDSALVSWLRGHADLLARDHARARAHFADALQRDASFVAAFDGLLEATMQTRGTTASALRSVIAAAPEEWRQANGDLLTVARRGKWTKPSELAQVWLLLRGQPVDDPLALAPIHPRVADRALSIAWAEIQTAAEPELIPRAREIVLAIPLAADPERWRVEAASLYFLLDEAANGSKALARSTGLDSTSLVGLVLAARARGELDDATARMLWRAVWLPAPADPDPALERWLKDVRTDREIAIACHLLLDLERGAEAEPRCVQALSRFPSSVPLAVQRSAAHAKHAPETWSPIAKQVFGGKTPPPFAPFEPHAVDGARGDWFTHRAAWLGDEKRHDDAAAAWIQAVAYGGGGPDEIDDAQLPALGWFLRSEELDDDAMPTDRTVLVGVAEGRLDIARADAAALLATEHATPPQWRYPSARAARLVEIAAADVAGRALDRAALAGMRALLFGEGELARALELATRHPRSALVAILVVEAALREDRVADAEPALQRLRAEHPDEPLVGVLAATVAVGNDDIAAALVAVREIEDRGPGSDLLRWAELPEQVRGRDARLDSVRDAKRFASMVRASRPAQHTTRLAATASSLEIGQPRGWTNETAIDRITVSTWDAKLEVRAVPRAERCTGRACAEPVLAELRRSGATILWSDTTLLPIGEATRVVAASRERLLVRWVVPLGARIFELRGEVELDGLDRSASTLIASAHTFRPLDAVRSAYDAESLRTAGPLLDDALRTRARKAFAVAAATKTCPVADVLGDLDDATASAVLLDLWLSTPAPAQRARLLPCAEPKSPRAARLGLVALLDESPPLSAYGRDVVAAQPDAAIADARLLIPPHDEALSDPDRMAARALPPRGVVELLLALPEEHARAHASRMLASGDAHHRAMTWATTDLRDGLVDRSTALALLGKDDAVRAAKFLGKPESAAELAAIRAALDGLTARTPLQRELLEVLAISVARTADRSDAERLARASSRVVDDPTDVDGTVVTREFLADIARAHALLVGARPSKKDNARVTRLVERWRAKDDETNEPVTRSMNELQTATLAEVLPGRDWVVARIGNPSLFGAGLRSLLARIQGERAIDTQLLARVLSTFLESPAARLLEPDRGIDLSRPLECAARAVPANGMICVAYVTDRDRVLASLGQRDHGEDAGVTLPLQLTLVAPVAPMALSVVPAMFHGILYAAPSKPARRVVAAERARYHTKLGGADALRYAIVRAYEEEISLDSERYLFVGDRLFVITSSELVGALLDRAEGPKLADDPDFRELTRGWATNTASLTAVAIGKGSPAEGPATSEITAESDGIRLRIRARLRERPEPTRLAELLPPGAASTIAIGKGVERIDGSLRLDDLSTTDREWVPPIPALAKANHVAFGWYPRANEPLWRRWIAIVDDSPATDRALRGAGLRIGKTIGRHGPLHTLRDRGVVLIATDATLLAEARARIDTPAKGDAPILAGAFDGKLAAAAIGSLSQTGGSSRDLTRVMGVFLSAVRHAEYRAEVEPSTGMLTLTGRIQAAVAAEETPDVVDTWLAAKSDGNSTRLPRRVRNAELGGTLTYTFEIDDAQWFVDRVISASPRVHARVVDATHAEIEVKASAATKPGALSSAERKRLTAPTSSFPSRDRAITKLLPSILDDAKSAKDRAAKITAFVHERLRYTVTPHQLDGVEVLDAGTGDCSEYSTLTVTLLRAAGIPAEFVSGMVASEDSMVAHAWVTYHDGEQWREIDPTGGTMHVSAGHLELSVVDALSLHSLGRLHVTKVTAASTPTK